MAERSDDQHAERMANHWWWRPGWDRDRHYYTWYVTFTGAWGLHAAAAAYQRAVFNVSELDPVPLRWLHLTLQGVGFPEDVTDTEVKSITDAVSARTAEIQPFSIWFDPALVTSEAIVLPSQPAARLSQLRSAVRAGIAEVRGADGVPDPERFVPHVSVAYANAEVSAADILEPLAAVDRSLPRGPRGTRARVSSIDLVRLTRDGRVYTWQKVAAAALDGS